MLDHIPLLLFNEPFFHKTFYEWHNARETVTNWVYHGKEGAVKCVRLAEVNIIFWTVLRPLNRKSLSQVTRSGMYSSATRKRCVGDSDTLYTRNLRSIQTRSPVGSVGRVSGTLVGAWVRDGLLQKLRGVPEKMYFGRQTRFFRTWSEEEYAVSAGTCRQSDHRKLSFLWMEILHTLVIWIQRVWCGFSSTDNCDSGVEARMIKCHDEQAGESYEADYG